MEDRDINELLKFSKLDNIAEELDGDELRKIAKQVIEDHDANLDSMSVWIKAFKKGEKLGKMSEGPLSVPFQGASNYKSTIMQEAAYRFGERATTELLRPKELNKSEIVGPVTPEKEATAKRTAMYMAFQINHEMEYWRDQQHELLYQLPVMGTIVKKTFFCPIEKHPVTDLIQYPAFSVNQNATSQDEITFTHVLDINENEAITLQNAGIWLDEDLTFTASSDNENKNDDTHNPINCFLEQQCFLDLDNDGYEEPYTVTLHKGSAKIVRILAGYSDEDIITIDNDVVSPLSDVYLPKKDAYGIVLDEEGNPEVEIPDSAEIVKIKRWKNLTFYRFMPALDGTFLGVGYYQLMSATIHAINLSTNALVNAGYLANMQGGWMARGVEVKKGDATFVPGQYKQTGLEPADLQNAFLPHLFKEPSQTLFALTQKMEQALKDLSASVDLSEIIAANTSATTVLMTIEQAQASTTSLISAQARSMSKEFQILFELNRKYTDPKQYQAVTDSDADYAVDFAKDQIDVIPTANPEIASKFQRIQQGQILMDQWERLQGVGANMAMVMRNYLNAIGVEETDQILPEPNKDTQTMMQEAAQAQKATAESQNKLMDAQSEALLAQGESLKANAEKSRTQMKVDMAKLPVEIHEVRAKIIKLLEEAESEHATNQIDLYMAEFDKLDRTIAAINTPTPEQTQPQLGGLQQQLLQQQPQQPQQAPQVPGMTP